MGSPTFVSLDTLHQEAKMWSADGPPPDSSIIAGTDDFSMAEVAGAAARAAGYVGVDATTLSWVADETGLLEIYEQLRLRTEELLGEGVTNFESVADELLAAMQEYSRTDGETDAAIRDVWQPKPEHTR